MKKKVLVTGGCGYIGSHTVVALIQNNFEVIIIDDLSNSNAQTLNNIKKITGVKPTFCECDLKDISEDSAIPCTLASVKAAFIK